MLKIPSPTDGTYVGQPTSRSWTYSQDNSIITPEQRDHYEKNGFLVIRNCVPKDKLEKYR